MEVGAAGVTGENAVNLVELEYVSACDAATLQARSSEVVTAVVSSPRDDRVNWPNVLVRSTTSYTVPTPSSQSSLAVTKGKI